MRHAQVERVRREAELAQQQYMLVRPENRLVADTLERQWNEKLRQLAEVEHEYVRMSGSDAPAVSGEDKQRIQSLVSDLPRVQIRWKGGATTQIERPLPLNAADLRRTPSGVGELLRALATEQTDARIARTLNARWLRSGTGMPFTAAAVRRVRRAYRIESLVAHLRRAGSLTATEMAAQLHIHPSTAGNHTI